MEALLTRWQCCIPINDIDLPNLQFRRAGDTLDLIDRESIYIVEAENDTHC